MQILTPILFLGLLSPAIALAHGDLTVDTSNGLITGHFSSSHPEVIEYLGVPYAQPPVGELRFEAPRPYQGEDEYIADNFVRVILHSQIGSFMWIGFELC